MTKLFATILLVTLSVASASAGEPTPIFPDAIRWGQSVPTPDCESPFGCFEGSGNDGNDPDDGSDNGAGPGEAAGGCPGGID